MAGERRKTYRERNEKAIRAIDRRAELLDLVEAYRGLKRDLGLIDFSDQIALAARLAATSPRSARLERAKFRVVLLDEYQDTSVAQALHAEPAVLGPDAGDGRPPGHRGRRPQPGDLRLARRLGLQHPRLRRRLPGGRRRADVATYPLTVNRRSDARILEVANRLAAPLYDAAPAGRCRSSRSRTPAAARCAAARARDVRRRARLARPTQVPAPHTAMADAVVARDRRADPRQRPRRRRLRRADRRARSRSRSSASRACCGCPRSPRWSPP